MTQMVNPELFKDFQVIAFAGPKYSGKDTAAKILLEHPNFVTKAPFAAGVKNICHEVFGWSFELMEDPELKEEKTSSWPNLMPRVPMMDVANWFRGIYGGDVWVRRNERIIAEGMRIGYHTFVITDWRFPEETEWLQSLGRNALKVYIQRNEAEEVLTEARRRGDMLASNVSESHYDTIKEACDVIITNNGTVTELQTKVLHATLSHLWSRAYA